AAMFGPLTHLGLRSLTVRYVPQHRDTAARYLGKMLVLRTMLALLVAVAVVAAAPLSGGSGDTRAVIAIAALAMVLSTIVGVYADGFQGFERVRPAGMASFAGGVVLTIASVIAIKAGGGIRELALTYVLGPLCTLGLVIVWSWRLPFRPQPSWDPAAFAQLLRQASPFFGLVILDVLSSRVDLLALARFLGEAKLGCY